jgi:hypothetical protein
MFVRLETLQRSTVAVLGSVVVTMMLVIASTPVTPIA